MNKLEEKIEELKFLIQELEKELSETEFGTTNYFRLVTKLDEYRNLVSSCQKIIKRKK
jgi:hypothetical protein